MILVSHEISENTLIVYHCIALHVLFADLIARCVLVQRSISIIKILIHLIVVPIRVLRKQCLFILLLRLVDHFLWAVLSLFF